MPDTARQGAAGDIPHYRESLREANMGVVSVREKVIQELRTVQERVSHDTTADVALEYCIKMIIKN